jgi:3-oxoacyl-[acyl-carrier protein] reductase
MDLGLTNRHALVTGASRGLGRAIASALAAEGAEVVAVARNLERLNSLATATAAGRGTITARACDLADASAIGSLGALLQQTDILVLNTGGPPPGPAADTSDAVWIQQFEAMFLSAIRLTRLALPGMRKRGFGRILAVVSSGVIQPISNLGISNALRSALVGWTKTLAAEVAGEGITVNCIAPGRASPLIGSPNSIRGVRSARESTSARSKKSRAPPSLPGVTARPRNSLLSPLFWPARGRPI